MGYLICENCEGYYELGPGESVKDFTEECECGGKLQYTSDMSVENKKQPQMKHISEYKETEYDDSYIHNPHEVYKEKNPVLAVFLSFLITGLGQAYNGQAEKGIILFVTALVCAILTLTGFIIIITFIFAPIGMVVWIFSMFDAYDSADKMNKGKPVKEKIQDYF